MMKFINFIFFISFYFNTFSQNVTGKIYDEKGIVKYIRVSNITQNKNTYTDDSGSFKINAVVNDSISFDSIFYEHITLKVTNDNFTEHLSIMLKEKIIKLDEIVVRSKFNIVEFNFKLNKEIQEDIKQNPYLYGAKGKDLISEFIFKQISKIFNKKRKENIKKESITYKQLVSLFEIDELFNNELLKSNLKIGTKRKYLFFNYCEFKNIDIELLDAKNKLVLLDTLVNFSIQFNEMIKEYEMSE